MEDLKILFDDEMMKSNRSFAITKLKSNTKQLILLFLMKKKI